jgi:hypothetical protein
MATVLLQKPTKRKIKMKEVPIKQTEEENYQNIKCRNARRKERCEQGEGEKEKMRRWENNTSWMRRRCCDKTPCCLVGKYQNTGGHTTKDHLLIVDCRGNLAFQDGDGASRGTGTAKRNRYRRTESKRGIEGEEQENEVRTRRIRKIGRKMRQLVR